MERAFILKTAAPALPRRRVCQVRSLRRTGRTAQKKRGVVAPGEITVIV
jgi:hypothetical protein